MLAQRGTNFLIIVEAAVLCNYFGILELQKKFELTLQPLIKKMWAEYSCPFGGKAWQCLYLAQKWKLEGVTEAIINRIA